MGYPQGHEFDEGDRGLVKPPEARVESPQFQVGDGAKTYAQIAQSTADLVSRGELGRAEFSPDGQSILFNRNGGKEGAPVELPTFAHRGNSAWRASLGQQFGAPVIVGADGTTYLQGYAAKGPADLNITPGIENLDDARRLVNGAAQGPLQYLSQPGAVNRSLLETGL